MTAWFEFPDLRIGTVALTVKGARGLKAADHVIGGEDTSDPFAVVSVLQTRDSRLHVQKFRTEKVECTLNPDWVDPSTGRAPVIYCDIWDLASATLYIDVYDADLTSDDYLGQARLTLHDYCVSSGTPTELELKLTPFIPAEGRALSQKHTEVMDVSGCVQVVLNFDVERARLEHSDKAKLDESLETAMTQRNLSESRKAELRKADAESKLQFIKFASVPPVLARQPPPLRGSLGHRDTQRHPLRGSLGAEAFPLQDAHQNAACGTGEQIEGQRERQRDRETERKEQPRREDPLPLRQRAPTTVPRPLPQRDTVQDTPREREEERESRVRPVLGRPLPPTLTDRDTQRDRQVPKRPVVPARPLPPALPIPARP